MIDNIVPWTYVINDVNGEKIVGTFYKKELQKTNQIATVILLTIGLIRKTLLNKIILNAIPLTLISFYQMTQYFPKPYKPFEGEISVKLDLSNYGTKSGCKSSSRSW